MFKWFFGIGVAGLLIVAAFVFYIYSNLDVFVERAIEEFGSQAVGVAVRVDRVELDLESGRASVFGLEVANPPGFEGPTAFSLGEITIDIDLETLKQPTPLVLDEIRIEAPVVYFEMNEVGQSNLDVLRANAKSGVTAESKEEPADSDSPPTRMRIRKLVFADGRVDADTRAIGGARIDARLARAELSDVGGAGGATGAEIGAVLVKELGRQTTIAVGRGQIDKLLNGKLGRDLGAKGGEAAKGLLDRFKTK
jgi:hypothetical protein